MSNLWKRVMVGVSVAAAVAGVLALDWRLAERTRFDGLPALVAIAAMVFAAALEAMALARAAGLDPSRFWTVLSSVLMPVAVWVLCLIPRQSRVPLTPAWVPNQPEMILLAVLTLAVLAPLFAREAWRGRLQTALPSISGALLCILFVGLLGSFSVLIRMVYGVGWFMMFIASAKLTDVGAYLVGRKLGRRKLSPTISPNKTIEGAIGGLVFGVAAAFITVRIVHPHDDPLQPTPLVVALFGVAVAVSSHLSDLAESILKRSASLKDSASSVPGFGGVLDLVDSLLFSAPVAFLVLTLFEARLRWV